MTSSDPLGGAISRDGGAISRDEESYASDGAEPGRGGESAWYVVETKRYRERIAQASLAQRGITSYAPRIVQWPRPAVGNEVGPMFPGYLFVRAALPTEFYRVVWSLGVKTFVTFGDAPAAVDARIIDFLRSRESSDGVIRYDLRPTEKSEVRIVEGPFRGLTAIVEQRLAARDRVRVLMHLLQRETSVELPDRWVRKV